MQKGDRKQFFLVLFDEGKMKEVPGWEK